ncbi:MAG: SRPBCC family protein [Bacteroidota bacterium]|nr:SRPBCC family protein [Bacteroidota bacterium]
MNIESSKINIDKNAQELFDLLSDVKNFEKLMPENISKFEVLSGNSFVFALKGMPEIKLSTKEVVAPNKVVLGATSDKIPFTLTTNINQIEEGKSAVHLLFEGTFNPMMAMMIKAPITKFIETLANNLKNL